MMVIKILDNPALKRPLRALLYTFHFYEKA